MGKRISKKSKREFAEALKAWRSRKGFSQVQAAEALGLDSVRTLQNWEIARSRPTELLASVLLKQFAKAR